MQRYIRAIAGSFILISLLPVYVHSRYRLLFTAFIGLSLLQSAFTGWCPREMLLEKQNSSLPGSPFPCAGSFNQEAS